MTEPDGRAQPSALDDAHYLALRENVRRFMRRAAALVDAPARVLDIAPQVHEGAKPFFPAGVDITTFDLDPASGAEVIGDICRRNGALRSDWFDAVVCTEVLEHTLRPFDAVAEIHRVLKDGGRVFISVPFNFRIHGPLPDCWRFTEHGLRELLRDFEIDELDALETEGRALMPIHYTVIARKRGGAGVLLQS